MTNKEILELIKLLSAVESWSFNNNRGMPDYMYEKIDSSMEILERQILNQEEQE